ncbi:MAG: ferredoxin [Myxococcota bacterium]|nr:ferredoxin [Myxococcota bacterium]
MKVYVDLDTCCGHGRCYALCPEVFGEDDEGYPLVSDAVIDAKEEDRARQAAANCPEAAITLIENRK